jgi:hypothetical protein
VSGRQSPTYIVRYLLATALLILIRTPSAQCEQQGNQGTQPDKQAPADQSFGVLASCGARCQQPNVLASANTLPDAPSVQNESAQAAAKTQSLEDVFDAARLALRERPNVGAASAGGAAHLALSHFDRQELNHNGPWDFVAKRISASTPSYTSESESLIRRASYAAASVVVTRDDAGRRRLNTSYLLRVLTTTVAHSAYVPCQRYPLFLHPASTASTASDFGSTIGEDAGMKVFHEFKPGILQLVKSHTPKFVGAIGERISNK